MKPLSRMLPVGVIVVLLAAGPSWGQMPQKGKVVGRAAGTDVQERC